MPNKHKKLLISLTLLTFVSAFFIMANSKYVQAVGGLPGGSIIDSTIGVSNAIIVADPVLTSTETERGFMDKLLDSFKWLTLKSGSQAFQSALRTMLNTLAYDSANYVASGLSGQKAAFETREFGDVIKDSMDAAAGDFISRLGDAANMNLCQPSLSVMPKIQLGLYQYQRPQPKCTFSELRNNWDNAIQSATFLRDFQNYFEPTSNDLGIALSIQSNFLEEINFESSSIGKQLEIDQGWLGIKNPVSGRIETPTSLQRKMAESDIIKDEGVVKFTGDALIDALNIFLNQLAIQLMRNLLYGGLSKGGGGGGGVYDFQADTSSGGGINAAKEKFRKIVQPKFNVRGDYNILAELTQCPDPNRAGPTNCVITDRFRQAIQDKKTVGQAMDEGLLNSEGIFGFSGKNLEPLYVYENYPYRSMLILRKFRILPVGWEVAANYINENIGQSINGIEIKLMTLQEMVDCFEAKEDETENEWCRGLVDPNWVLKAPLNYCARSGYGPETFGEPQLVNGQYVIARKDNYCADEQACIKENADGSCEVYGYCTEERRTWNFGSNSCNPLYNTCETFTADNGSSISYLKNTLDFCDASGAGCQSYALDYNYNDGTWNETPNIYFNKDVESCDSRSEGCHAFYRIDKDKWIDNPASVVSQSILDDFYNSNNLIYEKMLPSYLENICYENGWDEIENAPAICDTFARQCTQDEVGCELYTRARDSFEIPAKAKTTDRCPAQCNGYDLYIQQKTIFERIEKDVYLIPSNAQQCSAQAVGCDEFTNLDEVEKGGEGIEYYSQIKYCTTDGAGSDTFYTWEGSDDAGYQLRAFTLQDKNNDNTPDIDRNNNGIVDSVSYTADECSEIIFSKKSGDPGYNSDCRQFYSREGNISYIPYSYTITFSTNCHPYRHTDSGDTYMAIPQEGRVCSAREVGCRKYVGNVGNNVMNILDDDFESGTTEGWEVINIKNQSLKTPNDSLKVDNHSLQVMSTTEPVQTKKEISSSLKKGKTYVIEFLAKASADNTPLLVDIRRGTVDYVWGSRIEFGEGSISLNTDWKLYKLNLKEFSREPNIGDEYLHFESQSVNDFYLDYVILREVTDNYYLLKNSLNVPITCDQDWSGNPNPYYMAGTSGCYEYRDRDNNTHYLRQFSDICSESAVGCELMIDTQNSLKNLELADVTDDNSRIERSVGTDQIIPTPADSFIYMVYDRSKQCGETVKACQLTGKDRAGGHDNVYVKNDPDEYQRILCGSADVGCTEYKNDNGTVTYFKDPQNNVCEYRQGFNGNWEWWEKKVKRCDIHGSEMIRNTTPPDGKIFHREKISTIYNIEGGADNICATDNDCEEGIKCIIDEWDEECSDPTINYIPRTIGFGGNKIDQPEAGKVGLCPAVQSQCVEIIDPVSEFSVNLSSDGNVQLEPDVLYRLSAIGDEAIINECDSLLYKLDVDDNKLKPESSISTVDSILFYSGNNGICVVSGGELKEAIVNYQLAGNLDRTSCNGQVDTAEGCILFNERAVTGASEDEEPVYKKLIYDADVIDNKRGEETQQLPQCDGANCDSNAVLKVSPDRVCNEWLACKSKVVTKDAQGEEESACYDIGICDGLDESNQCGSWVSENQINQTVDINNDDNMLLSKDLIANATGYTKVGFDNSQVDSPIDSTEGYFPYGKMEQVGDLAIVPNGSFEISGANGYPIGWTMDNWNSSKGRVIDNPLEAEQLSIPYLVKGNRVIDGKKFLQLGSSYSFKSETIEVNPNEEYILTVQINTANLATGRARVKITGAEGTVELTQEARQSNAWMSYLKSFKTGNTGDITIKLSAEGAEDGGAGIGSFYFDNIQIRPALGVRDKTPTNLDDEEFWLSPQSCRLFPKSDSMSCDYIGDSGAQQKGWYGYCLEYDDNRQDGISVNPNACLQWWPVDRVKADGIDEGVGYLGKIPLYYSLEGTAERAYEYRHAFYYGRGHWDKCDPRDDDSPDIMCPTGYKNVETYCTENSGPDTAECICIPDGDPIALDGSNNNFKDIGFLSCGDYDKPQGELGITKPVSNKDGWYPYDELFNFNLFKTLTQPQSIKPSIDINNKYSDYLCDGNSFCELESELVRTKLYTTKIVQAVTPAGQNKHWSGRVYEGTSYSIHNISTPYIINYEIDEQPFGSITPPFPANNPVEWDSDSKDGIQPLYMKLPDNNNQARAGEVYRCNESESNDCKYVVKENSQFYPYIYEDFSSRKVVESEKSIKNIFAKSYGIWKWEDGSYKFKPGDSGNWDVPKIRCEDQTNRRANEYCAILPKVEHIKVNGEEYNDVTVIKNGFVNLTFNTEIDDNQEPLVAYIVNWGDGETTSVSGVEMRDRSNTANPYSLYHLYDYDDLNSQAGKCTNKRCEIKPTISIKDNWGWYNNGGTWNTKGRGTPFGEFNGARIIVREE